MPKWKTVDKWLHIDCNPFTGRTDVGGFDHHNDSFIDFNYTPSASSYKYGRIPVTIETPRFNNNISEGSFYIPINAEVYDAKVISYSGDTWTDKASIDNSVYDWYNFYNLSYFDNYYYILGDPYTVNIPVSLIQTGYNTIRISTGLDPTNSTGGSLYNKVIYTIGIDLKINYTGIFEKSEGCNWFVKFEDGSNETFPIPSSYSGVKQCIFTNVTNCAIDYDDDSIDNSVCYLFKQLDMDNDGRLTVKFDSDDLQIDTYSIGGIPYMWGPTVVEVRVWK